jgi:cytochrome c556
MSKFISRIAFVVTACVVTSLAMAGDTPQHQRHELMEGVGDAAKPVGKMLKGEKEFDAQVLMKSLNTFLDASNRLGDLFPPGSETGEKTRAAPAIWDDRDGFNDAIAMLHKAASDAIAANPGTLDEAKSAMGPVFHACKNCHDTYRLPED